LLGVILGEVKMGWKVGWVSRWWLIGVFKCVGIVSAICVLVIAFEVRNGFWLFRALLEVLWFLIAVGLQSCFSTPFLLPSEKC
jgi:hypothetical protein